MVIEIENKPSDTLFLVALSPEMSPAMRPGTYLVATSMEGREAVNAALTAARQNEESVEFRDCWLAILNVQMVQHPQQPGQVQIMHACHTVPFTMFDTGVGSDWVMCPRQWIFPSPELEQKIRSDREQATRELSLQRSGLVQAPANALRSLRPPQ